MEVDRTTARESVEHEGVTYHFCSADCRSTFERDPGRYAVEMTRAAHGTHLLSGSANPGEPPSVAARPAYSRQGGEMGAQAQAVDPVCGMTLDPATTEHRSDHKDRIYYFCSSGCKARFDSEPDRFVEAGKGAA